MPNLNFSLEVENVVSDCLIFTSDLLICLPKPPHYSSVFGGPTASSFFSPLHVGASKSMLEADPTLLAQNGTKKLPISFPELEQRAKKQHQHSIGINNNILHTVESKLQDIEYMENYLSSKRLNNELNSCTEDVGGTDASSASSSRHYKNSSPRSHSSTNGSVPSSSSRSERKQKSVGKNAHRELMENYIPNNQLSKPDALVR